MKLVIDIAALNKTQAAVVSITDTTPVTELQQLTLGGSEPLDITFTDSSASPPAAPSWAGAVGYVLKVGLGSTDADALLNYTSTIAFTPQTAGWTGRLNLATQLLIDATKLQCGFSVDRARFGGGYDGTTGALQARPRWAYFYLQVEVTDLNNNTTTYAVLRVPVLNRVLPTLVAESATSTDPQAVTANPVTGVLISPTNFFTGNGISLNPLTTLGDTLYGGASGFETRLAGNTTAALQVLTQTGTGVVSAAPAWLDTTGTGNIVRATAPTIAGGTHTAITSLGIRSTGAAFDLTLASAEVFTAGRTLTIALGNAARTLTLSGNPTLSGFTATGTGTLALGTKNLTVSNTLTLAGTDATTMTFPTTSATIARTDAANTFTGTQTMNAIASAALSNLTLGTGTFGTFLTATSATGVATFASTVSGTSTTAAAVLAKSLGLTENLYVGGDFHVNSTSDAVAYLNGSGASNAASIQFQKAGTQKWNLTSAGTSHDFKLYNNGGTNSYNLTIAYASGDTSIGSTTEATTGGAGSLTLAGGLYSAKKLITASTLTTLGGATFHTTSSALTDGAGISLGTLATAPSAGNPTKWIGINDNGTTRYIPAW